LSINVGLKKYRQIGAVQTVKSPLKTKNIKYQRFKILKGAVYKPKKSYRQAPLSFTTILNSALETFLLFLLISDQLKTDRRLAFLWAALTGFPKNSSWGPIILFFGFLRKMKRMSSRLFMVK